MNKKNWVLREQASNEKIEYLARELGVDTGIATLLVQRNINTYKQAREFFRPSLDQLHDPFLMKDMEKAVDRLALAIFRNEKIMIYGDYDVDGTTSVALVYSFLKKRYSNLDYYVPDRYSEGYGISFQGIDYADQTGVSLVIALDCGIKAVDKINYAKRKNIDFIICDHHTPGDELPKAIAVLDPKRADCEYPYKELSGCGVGFKLIQAFAKNEGIDFAEVTEYVDLVAVSIASDIVPITGENRVLAFFGLKKLNENPIPGLKMLKSIAGIESKESNISDVVFKIGPRINAAGRIHSGKKAVELMVADEDTITGEMGEDIDSYNVERKSLDQTITQEALSIIEKNKIYKNKKSTVLFKADWHKGVIGIVASRLTEVYYRPTIILTESNGKATGSARSVVGFNVYNAIDACSDLLEGFGGHMYAAGLTMKLENVPIFIERFEAIVAQTITDEMLTPKIEVDAKLNFEQITPKFYRILKQFAPFGPENMAPVFVTENVCDSGYSRRVGADKTHLKVDLVDERGYIFTGIAFSFGNYFEHLKSGKPVSICYAVDENEYRGNTNLQLMIKDIKILDEILPEV